MMNCRYCASWLSDLDCRAVELAGEDELSQIFWLELGVYSH